MVSPAPIPAGRNNNNGRAPRMKIPVSRLLYIVAAAIAAVTLAFLHATASSANEGDWDAGMRHKHKLALARRAQLGHLGPPNTKRENLVYYDSLYFTALQFGSDAASLIEVGCSADPFIQHLDWIDGRRICVAPYFVNYNVGQRSSKNPNTQLNTGVDVLGKKSIERVEADFMHYVVPHKFDLLLCGQVVEHVKDPGAFVKKLIRSARTSIISVPYKWSDCGRLCNHITHKITYKMILAWSAPEKPVYSVIVAEKEGKKNGMHRRIIVVFRPETKD